MVTDSAGWTFLTNHAHVLIAIWRGPDSRVREIASLVGITERAVMKILSDLSTAGYIEVTKVGRENRYRVVADLPLRHPLEQQHTVGALLTALTSDSDLEVHQT